MMARHLQWILPKRDISTERVDRLKLDPAAFLAGTGIAGQLGQP